MAYQKKEKQDKQATRGKNVLNDPEVRKEFKTRLSTVTHYFQAADDAKEGASETVADLAAEFGLDKKIVRKLATTMYKHSYSSLQEENRHFEILYEMVIEGKLRDDKPVILTADQAMDIEITNLVGPDDDASESEIEEAQ